jgi:DNA-binding PadR family transcriptional regulator
MREMLSGSDRSSEPGILYLLLHGLDRIGLLKSVLKNVRGHSRRVYKITSDGEKALARLTLLTDPNHRPIARCQRWAIR